MATSFLATSFEQHLRDLTWGSLVPWQLGVLVVALALTSLAVRIVNRTLRAGWWRHARRVESATADVDRIKRGQTLLNLLQSLVRYTAYGLVVFVGLAWITGGAGTAWFGASFVVVLIGFGLQRLLGDVVAGGLLVFEGHYAIGDVLKVHGPDSAAGIVEEFSLRTTTLRTFAGDRHTVLNGSITAFTRYERGVRELRLAVHARGSLDESRESVARAIGRAATWNDLPWLAPPAIDSARPAVDGQPEVVRVVVRMVVPPGQEQLVTDVLGGQLRAELGATSVGDVAVTDASSSVLATWRAGALDQLAQDA